MKPPFYYVITSFLFAKLTYCKCRYFCAAKFSRIKPYETYSRSYIFTHMPFFLYLFYYDYNFHSHQIFLHLKPCAKCAKICTPQKSLHLQYPTMHCYTVSHTSCLPYNLCIESLLGSLIYKRKCTRRYNFRYFGNVGGVACQMLF